MRPLGLLLDTVEALAEGALRAESQSALRALWRCVYEGDAGKDVCVAHEGGAVLAPALTVRAASRGGPYPLMLVGPHWRLFVSPEKGRSRIIVDARYLAEHGARAARVELERVAWWMYGPDVSWRLSRLDIACDVADLDMERFARLEECVTRSAGQSIIYEDGEREECVERASVRRRHAAVQTVTLGSASSRVQLCAYDKVAEVRHSEKTWQLDAARERGWKGDGESLTRVEFRLRGDGLKEFPDLGLECVTVLDDVAAWMPRVWAYLSSKSVRYCVPSRDPNRARWAMAEWWAELRALGARVVPQRVRCIAASVREERARRAARDVMRGAVAMVAEHASASDAAQRACLKVIDGESEHAPEVLVIAQALAVAGELLGVRALGTRDVVARACELRTRVARRRRAVAYADDPCDAWTVEVLAQSGMRDKAA